MAENHRHGQKRQSDKWGYIKLQICGSLTYLGIRLDDHAQANAAGEIMISAPDSAVKVAMIPTNEELVIARDTMHIVSEL